MVNFRMPSLTVALFSLILVFSSVASQSFRYENSDLSSFSASYENKSELVIELKSESKLETTNEILSPKIEDQRENNSVKVSEEDFNKLIYTVEQEAHDLSYEHKKLVAQVILNRVHHKKFPNSISKVLEQRGQFQGYINYKTKKFKPTWETILACQNVIKNNNYNNILFFYNRNKAHPKYRRFFEHNKKLTHVRTIEGHRFFALQ